MPFHPASSSGPHRIGAGIALLFCLSSGLLSWWIALTGQSVTGGLPLLPHAWNQIVGRVVFGLGGLACFGLARLALRDVLRPSERASTPAEPESPQP